MCQQRRGFPEGPANAGTDNEKVAFQNFAHVGVSWCEIWRMRNIDGFRSTEIRMPWKIRRQHILLLFL
jgi:hypothetical protein